MAASMAEINRLEAEDKEKKKREREQFMDDKAPAAATKLQATKVEGKDHVVSRLTKDEIEALLFKVYNITMTGSKLRKADYVQALQDELRQNIGKYDEYIVSVVPAASAPATAAPATAAPKINATDSAETLQQFMLQPAAQTTIPLETAAV